MSEVRAAKIESGTGILITKDRFAEFIISDLAIKMSKEFEIIIKAVEEHLVSIQFKGSNDLNWNSFVDVTEEFYKMMKN